MPERTLLFLSADDVRRALPMREAIECMKRAFRQLARGEAVLPPRMHLAAGGDGCALFMPCALPRERKIGAKMLTLFPNNARRALPTIQALVVLFDGEDGRPLAVLDGGSLTAIRTGAASGAATDWLARPDADCAAILGAGVQGRTQLEAVACVRRLREAWIHDPQADAAERFAAEMGAALGFPVRRASSAAEAVRHADILYTATTAREPVFADADLRPGAHVNAIGSYRPDVREVPTETVLRARIVVDHKSSALVEAGDLLLPIRAGLLDERAIAAELGELAAGDKPGRTSPQEVTLFKSVGVAVQDLAAAALAVENAATRGIGTRVSL